MRTNISFVFLTILSTIMLMKTDIALGSNSNTCNLFETNNQTSSGKIFTDEQFQNFISRPYNFKQKIAHREYLKLSNRIETLKKVLPTDLVRELLFDVSSSSFADELINLLSKMEQLLASNSQTTHKIKEIKSVFNQALRETLAKRLPQKMFEKRIKLYAENPKVSTLKLILGELSLEDVQLALHGGSPLKPTPDSILGKFILETGAQTLVRRFNKGPEKSTEFGEEKLVVKIGPQNFERWILLFDSVNYLMHYHTPRQGTLYLLHNGNLGSYGRLFLSTFRLLSARQEITTNNMNPHKLRWNSHFGAILPLVLLSSAEGNRAENFFKQASVDSMALTPWLQFSNSKESYCAMGGYASCTHWVGNIPIGDKLVPEYTMPGAVDGHASNYHVGPGPQSKKLVVFKSNPNESIAGEVWKVPGHAQLHEVLGLQHQQVSGELANPGYVAVSLTSQTTVDRVPVIFLFDQNHQTPIDPNFDPQINAI